MEHSEKLETAWVNYLEAELPNETTIFAGENNLDKDGQRIVCYLEGGEFGEEDPPNSGNRWGTIVIELRTPFSKLSTKEKETGKQEPLDSHKALADALQSAVFGSNPDTVEATVADLTIFGFAGRTPYRGQGDNYWISGFNIKMLSCPS